MAETLARRLRSMADRAAAAPKLLEAQTWITGRYGALSKVGIPTVKDSRVDSARTAGTKAGHDVAINTPVTSSAPAIAGLLTSS